MTKIKDKTLLLLSSMGILAFAFMGFIEHKPNRISQGVKYSSFEFMGKISIILIVLWVTLLALSFYGKKSKSKLVFIVSSFLIIGLLWSLQLDGAGDQASQKSARISLSSGFYLQFFSLYMIISTEAARIKNYRFIKWLGYASIFGFIFYLLSFGKLDNLSLIKEYMIKKTQFMDNLKIHAWLTLSSVLTGAIIAIPLGYLAYRSKKAEDRIMLPLSIIQTIPSLSLFGILLVPLSKLGKLRFFDALGVSGIGWAPAYIALSLYTLLPIGRNSLTGFYSVDRDIVEAARGMGMSRIQILRKIELPLAFPVIFAGIRIAFIQTIGGAVLAGLVGGGGMGSFVFLGLGEASADLILLGVLPIVFFTIALDHLLKNLEKVIGGLIND